MQNDNYITIFGWMTNDLGLSGNELNVFALIYGFSQDGESWFQGNRRYIADTLNISRPTVDKALNSLKEKGLIIKGSYTYNDITTNRYKVSLQGVKNLYRGCKETLQGVSRNFTGGCKETLHKNTNIESIKDITIDNNKCTKHKYGEYKHVLLTDREMELLQNDYEQEIISGAIKILDEYIEMKGAKYKSHYLALKKWAISEAQKGLKDISKPQSVFDAWMNA